MPLNSMGLGFVFSAQNLASGVMGDISKSLKGLEAQSGKSLGDIDGMVAKMGAGLTAGALGVGGLMTTFKLAQNAGDFEQALAGVAAVTHGTTEEMAQMKTAALDAARGASQFSPTKAMEGFNELAQAGYNVTDSMKLLKPALSLAAGSGGLLSVAAAAGTVAQAMAAYGIEVSQADRATDQMAMGANAFAMSAADVPVALGKMATGAFAMKQSMTEAMIVFGLTKNVVGNSEISANAANSAMLRMVDKDTIAKMKSVHVDIVEKATGQYRHLTDILNDLIPVMDKMGWKSSGWMKDVFGDDASKAINAIMSQIKAGKGLGGIMAPEKVVTSYRDGFKIAEGVNDEFAKRSGDTFSGAMKVLDNRVETMGIVTGEAFKNAWRPIVEEMSVVLGGVIDYVNKLNPALKDLFAITLMTSFAFLIFAGATVAIKAVAPLAWNAIKAGAVEFWKLADAAWAALMPLWPWILAGAALIAVIYAINTNLWGMGDAWDAVADVFKAGGAWIGEVFDDIAAYVGPLWDQFSDGVREVVGPAFGIIGEQIGKIMDIFGELWGSIKAIFAPLFKAFGDIGDSMDSTTKGPGTAMLVFFRALGDVIGGLVWVITSAVRMFLAIVRFVLGGFAVLVSFIEPVLTGIFYGLGVVFKWLWGWISRIFGWIGKAFGDIFKFFGFEATEFTARLETDVRSIDGEPGGPTPAGAAVATAAAQSDQQQQTPSASFDYAKLASVMESRPTKVELHVDSEKLASVQTRGVRAGRARASAGEPNQSGGEE